MPETKGLLPAGQKRWATITALRDYSHWLWVPPIYFLV